MKRLLLLFTFFSFLFTGCKENDEQTVYETYLKQGWKLVSEEVNGVATDLTQSDKPELLCFSEQSLCYLAVPEQTDEGWEYDDLRTAWSYDAEHQILNIAGVLPVTGYVDELISDKLRIHYYKYNDSGSLDRYQRTYIPVKVVIQDLTVRLAE